MLTTSSPTSSTPSPWSRSNGALAAWLGVSALLILAAFAGQASETSDDSGLPVFFRYDVAIGGLIVYAVLFVIAWATAQLGYGNAPAALGLRRFPLRRQSAEAGL